MFAWWVCLSSVVLAMVLICVLPMRVSADVKLPSVVGSNMVLQRDMELPVWGWADPGEEVTVKFADNEVKAKADDSGKWKVSLAPMSAGGLTT